MMAWLLLVLAAGFVTRLTLVPFGGHRSDLEFMRSWGSRLVSTPFASFYDTPQRVDYLPGGLWLQWVLARSYQVLAPGAPVHEYPLYLVKLVPTLADIGVGLLLFLLGRRLASPSVGLLAAALYTFNPASIFLTAVWGQWDSVPSLLALMALYFYWRGNPEWSLPLLTYAALIKPQFGALAPFFALAFLRQYLLPHARWAARFQLPGPSEPLSASLWRAHLAVIGSIVVFVLICLPFQVGAPPLPTRWSIFERLEYAYEVWPFATLNAFNIWALLAFPNGRWEPDGQSSLLGLSRESMGALLFAITYGAIVAECWFQRDVKRALLWACLVTTFAVFMLLTRQHERYLFPTVAFAALTAALAPPLRWVYAGVSLACLANNVWAYDRYYLGFELPWMYASNSFSTTVSLLNLGLLLYVLLRAPRDLERGSGAPADVSGCAGEPCQTPDVVGDSPAARGTPGLPAGQLT